MIVKQKVTLLNITVMKETRYSDFAERFRKVIEEYASGAGQSELAEMLGTSQSIISRVRSGSKLPPDSVMEKIHELWGIDMIDEVRTLRNEGRYNRSNVSIPSKNFQEGVPYYNVDFVGGFDLVMNDQSITPAYLINFKPYERATCWCNITGHSMEPEISHGDMIALRKVDDWRYLPFGEIYAIVTKNDMRTVKRLGPGSNKNTVTLIPTNKSPEYAPQEIKKQDILQIYEVMGCVKRF